MVLRGLILLRAGHLRLYLLDLVLDTHLDFGFRTFGSFSLSFSLLLLFSFRRADRNPVKPKMLFFSSSTVS